MDSKTMNYELEYYKLIDWILESITSISLDDYLPTDAWMFQHLCEIEPEHVLEFFREQ